MNYLDRNIKILELHEDINKILILNKINTIRKLWELDKKD